MKKIKNFFSKLKKIIFRWTNIKWLVLLLIIVIVILFFRFRKKVNEYNLENHSMYQYFTGFKIDYEGSVKLDKKEDRITQITFGDDVVNLNSTPLYYADSETVIFPNAMSVVKPTEGRQFKINYYSLFYKDLDYYSIKDGNYNSKMTNAVIYDGSDLYFFVEDVNVSINGKNITLGAMSYIVVDTFNKSVEVYDYVNDDCKVYSDVVDDVIISNNSYKLNASLDLMYYNDKSRLLIKAIDKLKHLS